MSEPESAEMLTEFNEFNYRTLRCPMCGGYEIKVQYLPVFDRVAAACITCGYGLWDSRVWAPRVQEEGGQMAFPVDPDDEMPPSSEVLLPSGAYCWTEVGSQPPVQAPIRVSLTNRGIDTDSP